MSQEEERDLEVYDDPRLFDVLTVNAFGPTAFLDGWACIHHPEVPLRRANCVVPPRFLPEDGAEVAAAVDRLEPWWAERTDRIDVLVSDHHPASFDQLLADLGYRREGAGSVHWLDAEPVRSRLLRAGAADGPAEGPISAQPVASRPTAVDPTLQAWIDAHGAALAAQGNTIPVSAHRTDDPERASVGALFGRHERRWLWLAGPQVVPEARGEGVVDELISALNWHVAWTAHVDGWFTHVVDGDEWAAEVVARIGFSLSHRFHYRVLDLG